MADDLFPWERYAALTSIAEQSSRRLGRTAMMKLAYFLQELRGVPLGYDFSLYEYGPFDSAVLADLAQLQALETLEQRVVQYPSGPGYEIHVGSDLCYVKDRAADFLQRHQKDFEWVLEEFGGYGAANLDLLSTMVFADREAAENKEAITLAELVSRVLAIKPRFSQEHAERLARWLLERKYLRTTTE